MKKIIYWLLLSYLAAVPAVYSSYIIQVDPNLSHAAKNEIASRFQGKIEYAQNFSAHSNSKKKIILNCPHIKVPISYSHKSYQTLGLEDTLHVSDWLIWVNGFFKEKGVNIVAKAVHPYTEEDGKGVACNQGIEIALLHKLENYCLALNIPGFVAKTLPTPTLEVPEPNSNSKSSWDTKSIILYSGVAVVFGGITVSFIFYAIQKEKRKKKTKRAEGYSSSL